MLIIVLTLVIECVTHAKQPTDWLQEWSHVSEMSIEQLEKAIESDKWHVRSSALLQLEKKDQKKAIKAARALIQDPALMVRSQAVRVLGKSNLDEDRALLLDQLYRSENFHRGQSLFIRREILKSVPFNEIVKRSQLVARLQQDKDVKIRDYIENSLKQRSIR